MRGLILLCLLFPACTPGLRPAPGPTEATLADSRRMDAIDARLELGDWSGAEQLLQQSLAEGWQHPRAFHLMGRVCLRRSDGPEAAEEAIPYLERAVQASPTWLQAHLELSQAYVRAGRYSLAGASFRRLGAMFPEHPVAPFGQGVAAFLQGDVPAAEAAYRQALERDPNHAPTLRWWSQLAQRQGDVALEQRLLDRYCALVGDDPAAWLDLATVYQRQDRLNDARRALETAYRQRPQPATARRLATINGLLGDNVAQERWEILAGTRPVDSAPSSP